jgi:RPA family protein
MTYYNRDMCLTGNHELVHCTAKFCGYEKSTFQVLTPIRREDALIVDDNLTEVFSIPVCPENITILVMPRQCSICSQYN